MRLGQGLGEYGLLAGQRGGGGGESPARDLVHAVEDFFYNATPTTWAWLGGLAFVLWFIFLRKR
jgi:hypothetical protein